MRKILLVDDSPFALKIMLQKLKNVENVEVVTASSGEEAIDKIPGLKPDLILTDYNMDGISGVDLCGWVKDNPDYRHIYTCIFTKEKTEVVDKIQGLELGADDYLFVNKISGEEMVAKVNSFLRISQLQKELKETIEIRDRFFSFIVHELRTPLTAIMGFTQFCSYPNTTEEVRTRYLDKINLNAHRIFETVNDILDISKLEAGKIAIDISKFDLSEVVNEVVSEQAILATKKGLEVINRLGVNSESTNYKVTFDKSILKTIITNFFNNALKYTKKGQITIWCTAKSNSRVKIGVTDTGPGISEEFLPLVFDSYSREKGSTKKILGTGIGMSLCKTLAEAVGAEIGVESHTQDSAGNTSGTTFFLDFERHSINRHNSAAKKPSTSEVTDNS